MALASSLVSLGTFVAIFALLAIGLNIKFGFTGLLDIGHVTFYLVGAYMTVLLVLPPSGTQQFADYILGWNLPAEAVALLGPEWTGVFGWIAAAAVAMVLAGIVGMLVALPAVRLREDYLAITVLGFSVIAKRIIQTQGWLANGPGSLRGYGAPLAGFFPLPGSGLTSSVLFGLIVVVFWSVATYMLAVVEDLQDTAGIGQTVLHGLYAVTTLGIGYAGARMAARGDGRVDPGVAAGAGAVAGLVGAGLSLVGLGELAVFAFLGAISTFTWVFAAVAVSRRYAEMERSDGLVGLGLAIAFVVAFLPLIILGGGTGDVLSTVGLLLTMAFLVAYVYGIYYLGSNWDQYSLGAEFVSVIGVGAIWLFAVRYFLLALVTPFKRGGISEAIAQLIQNTLWLVKFSDVGVQFNYARFLFVLAVATVAVTYYVTEITVKSPFGRVLKAIREDEDVATALGKNTFSFKIQAMILGSAIAGLAGALWAITAGALVHTMFAPRVTFTVFLMLIIGGTANNRGMILGAGIFWAFQKGTETIKAFFPTAAGTSIAALRLAFIGALLIVILYYRKEGLLPEEKMTSPEVDQ